MSTTALVQTIDETSQLDAVDIQALGGLEDEARSIVASVVCSINPNLLKLNHAIHSHPETCYEEVFAHKTLTDFIESHGFHVQRHAYGLDTAFAAEAGSGGRLVIICAEYDALPGIGHGCGHNLIATASITAFIGAAKALLSTGLAGRIRILGTPAEEGGGGKIKLIEAGAFSGDISAAIMCHALPLHQIDTGWSGIAGFRTMASRRFHVEFRGRNAHAGSQPWDGINALDAAVAAYSSISMLRQHIRPYERIQGVIEDGGKVPNIIPDYSRMAWGLRSNSIQEVHKLFERVESCIKGAADATRCTVDFTSHAPYMELRVNDTLCEEYIHEMALLGEKVVFHAKEPSAAGTDMGNVSYIVPSFHGIFGIATSQGTPVHHQDFAKAAGTLSAHNAAVRTGKALALLAIRVLLDADVAARVEADFARS